MNKYLILLTESYVWPFRYFKCLRTLRLVLYNPRIEHVFYPTLDSINHIEVVEIREYMEKNRIINMKAIEISDEDVLEMDLLKILYSNLNFI